jgi:hypothetical protein
MIDIATLLDAVKPKQRTDQYVIFCRIFALQAHTTSVTAKQISDMLKPHLGAKAPAKEVNASLRAYAGYVTPTEKVTPLRWSLNSRGVERLRLLSGPALWSASDAESFNSDIGIACARWSTEDAWRGRAWEEVGDARQTHVCREINMVSEGGRTL